MPPRAKETQLSLGDDQIEQPVDAFAVYCEMMQGWVDAVRRGAVDNDVFPVEVPKDADHAETLAQRISLLSDEVIPNLAAA